MILDPSVPDHWLLNGKSVVGKAALLGPAVIFDIDGVLSDAAGRQHLVDGARAVKDWDRFFQSCGDDPLIDDVAALLSLLDSRLQLVLLTGRPVSVREQTLSWLKSFSLRWDCLIMRNFGDYTAAKEFKSRTVDELRSRGTQPVLAFEDDRRNVEMFRSKDIPCIYIHSGYYDRSNP